MNNWTDKIAVVTGAGSGIGAALAKRCANLGMQVYGCDIDTAGLAELAKDIASRNQSFEAVELNITDENAIEALAEDIFQRHGAVHLLFNNAGVLVDGKIWQRSGKEWRWNFDVNVMGVVYGIRSFVPRMLKQQQPGRVINTASIGGLMGGGGYLAPYQGTKHAVVAITESLHSELEMEADAEITASCLCPGDTATGIWESERHLPENERVSLGSQEEQGFHDTVAGMCAVGMTPDQVAEKTFAGIEDGKFWIFPDPAFKDLFKKRVEAIINETMPPSAADFFDAIE